MKILQTCNQILQTCNLKKDLTGCIIESTKGRKTDKTGKESNMKYINADELIEKYLEEENYFPTDDYFEGYIDGIIFCHRMVDEMPAADVRENIHGEERIKNDL